MTGFEPRLTLSRTILPVDPLQSDGGDYDQDPDSSSGGVMIILASQGRAAPESDGFRFYAVKIEKDDDREDVIVTDQSTEYADRATSLPFRHAADCEAARTAHAAKNEVGPIV
jgi:hypothetical protein